MVKYYLDEEGLQRLVEFIMLQLSQRDNDISNISEAIDLLNKTDGTPGSVKKTVDDIIENLDLADLQNRELLHIYGGSASEVLEEVNNNEND